MTNARVRQVIRHLEALGDKDIAARSRRFFKTGKGEYGEGDRFLGIRVPALRKLVKAHRDISLAEALEILKSPYHEARLLSLLILVAQYSSGTTPSERSAIYRAYLGHTKYINSWDLVDGSAEHILGAHLFNKSRTPLYRLARSPHLWDRRIGVVATFHFIKKEDFSDTLAIAQQLLHDPEDLVHKAVGWMLREVWKRGRPDAENFLLQHHREMPRTMLRYAIEKMPEPQRLAYLRGTPSNTTHPKTVR